MNCDDEASVTSHYILIAEDDQMIRHVLARVVQNLIPQAQLIEVGNGLDALDVLQQYSFSAVLTDFHMPGASGLNVVTAARNRSATLPIIVISAHPGVEVSVMAAGATAFIAKPFAITTVTTVLRAALPTI